MLTLEQARKLHLLASVVPIHRVTSDALCEQARLVAYAQETMPNDPMVVQLDEWLGRLQSVWNELKFMEPYQSECRGVALTLHRLRSEVV